MFLKEINSRRWQNTQKEEAGGVAQMDDVYLFRMSSVLMSYFSCHLINISLLQLPQTAEWRADLAWRGFVSIEKLCHQFDSVWEAIKSTNAKSQLELSPS